MDLEKIFMPFSNWKVLLLSFLGAATFWFFSALAKQYTTRIRQSIEFQIDQDSLIVMQPLAEYVELDVTGGGWDLFRKSFWFGSDPITITLDNPVSIKFLTRATIFPIVRDQLNQFQVNFLYTDTLFIAIERKESKKVLLDVDSMLVSMDANHRMISKIDVFPDTALIYGPTSFLDTLLSTFFVPITAEQIDRSYDRFVTLGLPEDFSIASEPSSVNVVFDVDQFDRLQLPVDLDLLNFPDDSSAIPTRVNVDVKFTIQRSLREDFFSDDFRVMLDYDMMDRSDSTAPAIVMIHPENVLEVEAEPDSIKIAFRE